MRKWLVGSARRALQPHVPLTRAVEIRQENPLPATELKPAFAYRDGLRGADQRRLDVGGGVALGVPVAVLPGHQVIQGAEEICQDVRICVLVDEYAGGGVGHVDVAETV